MGVSNLSPDSDVIRDTDKYDIQVLAPPSMPLPSSPKSGASISTVQLSSNASSDDSLRNGSGSSNCTNQVATNAVTVPLDWTADDLCPYYRPRSDGCTEPRTCRDCLNINVNSTYSCLVNQYGRCVQKSPSTYVSALDFRYQNASNNAPQSDEQRVQFLADRVNYCKVKDKECQHCRDTVFADVMEGRIDGSLTKFCYGKGGCVCIAVCEASIWKSTIGLTVCNGVVVTNDYDGRYANTYGATLGQEEKVNSSIWNLLLGGGLAAAILVFAAVVYIRKRRSDGSNESVSNHLGEEESREDEFTREGSVPRQVPAAPQLSLFGWQSMRTELIEREQLLLAGVEDFSDVRTGYLQLLDTDASAPPPEEDESSAPVLLVPLAGASAPSFSPSAMAMASSRPLISPSAPPASPTLFEDELL